MSDTLRFTLVLTCVCAAAAGGVGGVYLLTKEPIAAKAEMTRDEVRKTVLPKARVFTEVEKGSGVDAAREVEGGPVIGYVAVGEAAGYGGKLLLMAGLGAECAAVKSEDTLWTVLFGGERTVGVSWMDQFQEKKPSQLKLGGGIDAKVGCTITSKAVVEAAKAAIRKVEDALKTTE